MGLLLFCLAVTPAAQCRTGGRTAAPATGGTSLRRLAHGAAQQLRAEQQERQRQLEQERVRQAHLAEIRRGRWRRRRVWVGSLPGRFDAALRRGIAEENRILVVFLYALLALGLIGPAGLALWAGFLR